MAGGSGENDDTCPTTFSKKKDRMPKNLPQNKYVTKERGNDYEKVEESKCKRWAWREKLGEGGKTWKQR